MQNIISRILPIIIGLLITVVTIPAQASFPAKFHPGHYILVYFGAADASYPIEFNRIRNEPNFIGAHRRYRWEVLEPSRGIYDFSVIEADLKYLMNMPTPKRLIIEIADNSTAPLIHVPDYLKTAEFDGGYFDPVFGTRLMTKRWNKGVQDRLIALFNALGARFDKEPYVEGIVLDETANAKLFREEAVRANYTPEAGFAGQKRIMSGLKAAFPNTMCIQQINYFSGANAEDEQAKLNGFVKHAFDIGMGIGAPDVYVGRSLPTYPLYAQYAGSMPLAPAVQWTDYSELNPLTGRAPTVAEILDFANRTLHVSHLSWEQREPYFTNEVIPLVRRAGPPTGSALPPASSIPTPLVASAPSTPASSPVPVSASSPVPPISSPAPNSLSDLLARIKGGNPGRSQPGASNSRSTQLNDFLARNRGTTPSQSLSRLKQNRKSANSSASNSLRDLLARINSGK